MSELAVPEFQHRTVLLDEAVDALAIAGDRADGIYVDGTFGRGGHSPVGGRSGTRFVLFLYHDLIA